MFVQTAFQDQAHGFIGAVALLGAATAVGRRALASERGQRLQGQRLPARLKEGVQHMPDRFKSGAARLKRGECTMHCCFTMSLTLSIAFTCPLALEVLPLQTQQAYCNPAASCIGPLWAWAYTYLQCGTRSRIPIPAASQTAVQPLFHLPSMLSFPQQSPCCWCPPHACTRCCGQRRCGVSCLQQCGRQ